MFEENDTSMEEVGDLAEKMMGQFLARILHLDNLMSNIMSQHFCSDNAERAALFLSLITPDMSFRKKINIFTNMLKIYYNDIYKINISDLRNLYELDRFRNDLVNLMLPDLQQVLNKKEPDRVQFLNMKNGKTIDETAKKEYETKVRICIKLAAILNKIQREVVIRSM